MAIERLHWSNHAEMRLMERGLERGEVERAIRDGDGGRQRNRGDADWRIYAESGAGQRFVVIYDNPVQGDGTLEGTGGTARIVSVWRLRT
jgi:hypothetical protein